MPEANTVAGGLQGQVPWADRISGRAVEGYNCNLKRIGNYPSTAWSNFDTYKHCAYYGNAGGTGGTVVLDVSDPTKPVQTAYLTTPAMVNPWESLRVHAKRGLLVADRDGTSDLDVYDISGDCAHPKLLTSAVLPDALGHEGWFAPDGLTYYMTSGGRVSPIDLTDPANPEQLATWTFAGGIHGGSMSDDGTRAYMCNSLSEEQVLIVDTSDVQLRRPDPEAREVGRQPLPDNFACQATYRVTYGGRPFVIQFGELNASAGATLIAPFGGTISSVSTTLFAPFLLHTCPQIGPTNFSAPHIIDIADETSPKLAATLMLQVDDPAYCELVMGDVSSDSPANIAATGNPINNSASPIFIYDVHHCSPDRLHDPTILACAHFSSGLRVFDIRDPYRPKELAYYNPGTVSRTDMSVDQAIGRPVVRTELGQIWFATGLSGFHVVEFAKGVWPFPETPKCPPVHDYFFNHYNPGLGCK